MFKPGLLTSTAMTAVALLLSGAPVQAQDGMHVADRNTNSRFLCTYGAFPVSNFSSGPSYYSYFSWTHVAVPITGHGQTVTQIVVKEAQGRSSGGFSAGIYGNSGNGPGKLIAGNQGHPGRHCGRVTIPIAPTTLKPNTKYWIEEKANWVVSATNRVNWAVNPKTKRKAYVQTYYASGVSGSCCISSSTSPWTKQASGPWFNLK